MSEEINKIINGEILFSEKLIQNTKEIYDNLGFKKESKKVSNEEAISLLKLLSIMEIITNKDPNYSPFYEYYNDKYANPFTLKDFNNIVQDTFSKKNGNKIDSIGLNFDNIKRFFNAKNYSNTNTEEFYLFKQNEEKINELLNKVNFDKEQELSKTDMEELNNNDDKIKLILLGSDHISFDQQVEELSVKLDYILKNVKNAENRIEINIIGKCGKNKQYGEDDIAETTMMENAVKNKVPEKYHNKIKRDFILGVNVSTLDKLKECHLKSTNPSDNLIYFLNPASASAEKAQIDLFHHDYLIKNKTYFTDCGGAEKFNNKLKEKITEKEENIETTEKIKEIINQTQYNKMEYQTRENYLVKNFVKQNNVLAPEYYKLKSESSFFKKISHILKNTGKFINYAKNKIPEGINNIRELVSVPCSKAAEDMQSKTRFLFKKVFKYYHQTKTLERNTIRHMLNVQQYNEKGGVVVKSSLQEVMQKKAEEHANKRKWYGAKKNRVEKFFDKDKELIKRLSSNYIDFKLTNKELESLDYRMNRATKKNKEFLEADKQILSAKDLNKLKQISIEVNSKTKLSEKKELDRIIQEKRNFNIF